MYGFVSVKGFFIIAAAILLFGGAIYDIMTTGVRCGLTLIGKEGYSCEGFLYSIGSTIVFPDRNVHEGVESIMMLREIRDTNQTTYDELKSVISTNEQTYINQILLGIIATGVLVGIIIFGLMKVSLSSSFDWGGRIVVIISGLLIYCVLYMLFTSVFEGGMQMPFSGIISLVQHPEVLTAVVDYTSYLPGTLTTGDILNNASAS